MEARGQPLFPTVVVHYVCLSVMCCNTLLANDSLLRMPSHPCSTAWELIDCAAGTKFEMMEHDHFGWVELLDRPTTAPHRCCTLCWPLVGVGHHSAGQGHSAPMPSHPSSALDLMGFAAGTKKPEVMEHGQLGWDEVEVRSTTVTHSWCTLWWHMGGALQHSIHQDSLLSVSSKGEKTLTDPCSKLLSDRGIYLRWSKQSKRFGCHPAYTI